MRLLLDTHALLWWWVDKRLGAEARAAIADPTAQVLVSAASCWEIAIKHRLGKLDWAPEHPSAELRIDGFEPLAITAEHGEAAGALPLHHRDPFDRMIIAQAQSERAMVVTADPRFASYDVQILKADG